MEPARCITLELTGPLERAVGATEVTLALQGPSSLGRVMGNLIHAYPAAATVLAEESFFESPQGKLPSGLLVIRDGVAIDAKLDTEVCGGQRLTLMPMISGG